MGFRQGAYAKIWSVNDMGKYSTANVSISRKNPNTNGYDIEFSNKYVRLVGSAHEAAKDLGLPTNEEFNPETDRGVSIKITSCDVSNNFNKETMTMYTNFVIFGFEIPDNNSNGGGYKNSGSKKATNKKTPSKPAPKRDVDDDDDNDLPF